MKAAAAVLSLALLCAPFPAGAKEPGLRVLASFLPIYLFAQNVVGDAPGVTLEVMLPPMHGPHDYALTPGDMRKISRADLFLANGRGMEEFLGNPIRRANPAIRVVESAAAVPPLERPNPHTWVSPRNAILQVRAIERALVAASPETGPIFHRNADAYVRRLEALVRECDEAARRFRNRRIVTFHNAFDYLARDLHLTIIGHIEETPGEEPSAGEAAALVRRIRDTKPAALFAEPQYPVRLAEVIAQEAGIPVRTLDPVATGSVSPSAYEDAMRRNLAVLEEALSAR
jgi:zinc transport system substrate-binding protein